MMTYRLLFIANARCLPTAGGVERATLSLAQSLIAKGHYAAVLYTSSIDISGSDVCPIQEFCMPAAEPYRYDAEARLFYRQLLEREAINVVIFQNAVTDRRLFFLENAPGSVIKIANVNVEATHRIYPSARLAEYDCTTLKSGAWWLLWHTAPPLARRLSAKLLARHYRQLARCADAIVFRAEAHRRAAIALSGIDDAITCVVPNSCAFHIAGNEPCAKEKLLLFVGRLVAYKQPLHFLRAWQRLALAHPDWQAAIVGDGPERASLERYIARHSIERITLSGQCDPVPYYRRAAILAFTSATEGFGNVVVEAMAHGCVPVAYSTAEAMPEVITPECGIVSEPSPDALAVNIENLINSPERLRDMEREAVVRASAFTPEVIADKWLTLLSSH